MNLVDGAYMQEIVCNGGKLTLGLDNLNNLYAWNQTLGSTESDREALFGRSDADQKILSPQKMTWFEDKQLRILAIAGG